MVGGRCKHRPPIIALLSYGCQLADSRPTVPLRSPTLSSAVRLAYMATVRSLLLGYSTFPSSPLLVGYRNGKRGKGAMALYGKRAGTARGQGGNNGGRCLHRPPYCPLSALRSPLSYCPLSAHVRESTSAHVKGLLGVQDGK